MNFELKNIINPTTTLITVSLLFLKGLPAIAYAGANTSKDSRLEKACLRLDFDTRESGFAPLFLEYGDFEEMPFTDLNNIIFKWDCLIQMINKGELSDKEIVGQITDITQELSAEFETFATELNQKHPNHQYLEELKANISGLESYLDRLVKKYQNNESLASEIELLNYYINSFKYSYVYSSKIPVFNIGLSNDINPLGNQSIVHLTHNWGIDMGELIELFGTTNTFTESHMSSDFKKLLNGFLLHEKAHGNFQFILEKFLSEEDIQKIRSDQTPILTGLDDSSSHLEAILDEIFADAALFKKTIETDPQSKQMLILRDLRRQAELTLVLKSKNMEEELSPTYKINYFLSSFVLSELIKMDYEELIGLGETEFKRRVWEILLDRQEINYENIASSVSSKVKNLQTELLKEVDQLTQKGLIKYENGIYSVTIKINGQEKVFQTPKHATAALIIILNKDPKFLDSIQKYLLLNQDYLPDLTLQAR